MTTRRMTAQGLARCNERLIRDLKGGPIMRCFMDRNEKRAAERLARIGVLTSKKVGLPQGQILFSINKNTLESK